MAREVTLVDAGLGNIASVERALIQVGGAVRVTRDPSEVAKARTVVFPGQGAFGALTTELIEGQMGNALRMVIERGDPFLGICLGMQLLFDGSDENEGQKGFGIISGRCRRFPDGMEVAAEQGAQEVMPEAADAVADTSHAQTEATEPPAPEPLSIAADAPRQGAVGSQLSFPSESAPFTAPAATPAPTPSQSPSTVGAPAQGGNTPARQISAQGSFDTSSLQQPPAPPAPEPRAEPEPEKLIRRLKVPHMGWNSVEPTGDHYYFVHSYYVETQSSDDVMWMTTYGGIRFPAAVRRGNVLGCQFHPEKSQRAGLKFLRAFLLGGWG